VCIVGVIDAAANVPDTANSTWETYVVPAVVATLAVAGLLVLIWLAVRKARV
jgi:hypothetical protein